MSDEDNKALNEQVGEDTNLTESPTEETKATGEVVDQEISEASEYQGETAETENEGSKKGYSNRVRELNTRAKQAEERAKSLEEKLSELTDLSRSSVPTEVLTQSLEEPIFKPGEEIDTVEFEKRMKARDQRILQQATASSELRSRQFEAINRIKTESSEVVRKYPELDPDNENFNSDLSNSITEAVEALVKNNPYSASVTKFVDKLMIPYKGAVSKEVGKHSEELAKQVSQGAIKPTNLRKQEKSLNEKTIQELEAELGIVQA